MKVTPRNRQFGNSGKLTDNKGPDRKIPNTVMNTPYSGATATNG
jgi:hypothetical protein